MTTRSFFRALTVFALATVLTVPAFAAGMTNQFAEVATTSTTFYFAPFNANDGAKISISGPAGVQFEQYLAAGETSLDLADLPDGLYTYELRFVPKIDQATRKAMKAARAAGDAAAIQALRDAGKLPKGPQVQSGSFRIQGGVPVAQVEEAMGSLEAGLSNVSGEALTSIYGEAQVFTTDLIVQGSGCIGFDCSSSESFGFDTLRLKENNLRIHFDDTSSSASFPKNDWRIVANDSGNGGNEYFGVEDSTAGRRPFTIEAGAQVNTLYVEADGDVGIKTSEPVVDVHIVEGNTPTVRLEQDGSDGFASQVWDIAGNETNFFIRDVSNGSKLPFRIFPGGGDNTLNLHADSDVSIGKQNAANGYKVDIADGDAPSTVTRGTLNHNVAAAALRIEDTNTANTSNVIMAHLINNGPVSFLYENSEDSTWGLNNLTGGFAISLAGSGVNELLVEEDGDVVIQGMLTQLSSRTAKRNITPVDANDVLDAVLELPVATWEYDRQEAQARHLGPMAEDFYAAFGLGETSKGLSSGDAAGVALAAIQGLAERFEAQLDAKDQMIQQLQQRLEALEQAAE